MKFFLLGQPETRITSYMHCYTVRILPSPVSTKQMHAGLSLLIFVEKARARCGSPRGTVTPATYIAPAHPQPCTYDSQQI